MKNVAIAGLYLLINTYCINAQKVAIDTVTTDYDHTDTSKCVLYNVYNGDLDAKCMECYSNSGSLIYTKSLYLADSFFVEKKWYLNGNLKSYWKAYFGDRVGVYISYYDNGNLHRKGSYIGSRATIVEKNTNGITKSIPKHGDWLEYDIEGNVIKMDRYEFGIKVE